MSGPKRIVIVGASAAGLAAAEAPRRRGYDGALTLIGNEQHLPYDQPPLSKQILAGTWEPDKIVLRSGAELATLDADLLLGRSAVGLDMADRRVLLHGGDRVDFDALVHDYPGARAPWLCATTTFRSKKCEKMSHHLDSPIARADVRLNISDVYLFRGERGTAFVMNVGHSLGRQDVRGFHPEAMYEFKGGGGDAVEELTDRVTFVDGDVVDHQLQLRRISGAEAADPLASGIVLAEGSTDSTVRGEDGPRLWAGKAGNPFWVEPDVLRAALACCSRPRGVRDLMATVSSRARSRARR